MSALTPVPTPTSVLTRRIKALEDQATIVRRLADFDPHPRERERIYRFIATEAGNFSVSTLCATCGVARSSYAAWAAKEHGVSDATWEEAKFANTIYDTWAKSRGRYGSPRVTA